MEKPAPQADTGAAEVRRYLESTGLEAPLGGGIEGVEFLARGEYSLNYQVRGASQGGEPDEDLVARLIEGITDLVVEVEGKGNQDFKQYCWVIVDEIELGMLGVGGQGLTTEDVKGVQAAS